MKAAACKDRGPLNALIYVRFGQITPATFILELTDVWHTTSLGYQSLDLSLQRHVSRLRAGNNISHHNVADRGLLAE